MFFGIVGKYDLKITHGTYNITAAAVAIEANDSIRIAGGAMTAEAGDDGIHAASVVQVNDGKITVTAAEGKHVIYVALSGSRCRRK